VSKIKKCEHICQEKLACLVDERDQALAFFDANHVSYYIYIPKSPKAVLFESLGKVAQKGIIAEKP